MDYEPLDLSVYCNTGPSVYEESRHKSGGTHLQNLDIAPPVGVQHFHGLPFHIGNGNSDTCFVTLGADYKLYQEPVKIAVGKTARYVIFAHAVLETQLWQGGPLGEVTARYNFHYEQGQPVEVPIRERFEIGNVPVPWGQDPFLCVPDQKDSLVSRYEGAWEMVGWRQTEAEQGRPHAYFIWVWSNPHPEQTLTMIELVPTDYKVVVAAITLGHLDEWPLCRATRRPVKITLTQPEQAEQPFNLEVVVDRGVTSYPYPLPQTPLAEAALKGFGAPLNQSSSPAYTEIAATPSATVAVKQNGIELAQVGWGELTQQGSMETSHVRLEVIDPGKNWVRVTVVDEDTGQPLPCRIAFHSPEGVPYAPHGHHAPLFSNMHTWHIDVGGDVRLGQISYAYIAGKCQGWLPRGKVLVDVARGFEYEPLRTWVEIEPGQQQLRLSLKRWIDMKAERYFSGDTHVHFLSTQGSMTEAAGEDLNVVNLLLSQWGHLFTNTEEFTGRPSISADGQTIVYASQENRQHILGHLSLLGLKEPVMPWCSDGPSEAELGGGLDVTLSHWADACHAQGGTVIIPHLPTPNAEPAVLIATGRADAVEMLEHQDYEHLEYYRYLNGGYQLPLVGGTDKMSAETPVGLYRTYVYLPADQEFTYDNWCRALRQGRTFVSGGALLWFTVEGQPIGSTLRVKGGGTVEISAHARSIFPIHTLQIIQQGQVVAQTTRQAGTGELHLQTQLKISNDTWLAARCAGPNYSPMMRHFDRRGRGIMAHTSPIYIVCGDEYTMSDPATAQYMLTLIEGGLAYIRQSSHQYPPAHVTHHHGHDDHQTYLEQPFHQAQAAIHRRLHRLGIPH